MIRKLYDWTMDLASKPHAVWALFLVAFAESSFFPIPPDLLLIPMVLAMPSRAFFLAFICTLGSVLGGVFGYYIGAVLYEQLALPILEFYHLQDKFASWGERYNELGIWAVLVGGLTPVPFKLITILSGATGFSFGTFVVSATVARATRFFLVAILLYFIGPPAREFVEKRLGLMFTLFCILLIGGFLLIKFV